MYSQSHSPYRDLDETSSHVSQTPNQASQSCTDTPSSIRPRNRRGGPPGSTELSTSADLGLGLGMGAGGSRTASPIPPKHPSRVASGTIGKQGNGSGNGRPVGGFVDPLAGGAGTGSPTMGFGRGLWGGAWTGSWSAVQGLASSYLGGDVGDNSAVGDSSPVRKGKGVGISSGGQKKAPTTWGPSGLRQRGESIGPGSSADLSAALTAKKTVSVLESGAGVNGGLDVSGNYKRRTSMEVPMSPGLEEEALCYVHIVQPTDTQVGVVLKYQCQDAAAFRKANRLYPNDPLQLRKTVLLPVETCTIKGRPCEGASDYGGVDLLAPTPSYEDGPSSSSYTNGTWGSSSQEQQNPFAPSELPHKESSETPWTHVRWVLLSSSPSSKPTEIVRLPRKTLGFFPPRRRKSSSRLSSSFSTPRSSVDLLQSDSPFGTPHSLTASTSINSYFPLPASSLNTSLSSSLSRARADSTSSVLSSSPNPTPSKARVPSFMRRPGGVGTMARNVRAPGPAQDGFNAWATRQFPNLTIDHLPSISVSSTPRVENLGFGFREELESIGEIPTNPSAAVVGADSSTGTGGFGFSLGVGNLEGWVRKTMTRAPGTPKLKPSGGRILGGGIGGVGAADGDLIELLDGAGSDDGRGFEPSTRTVGPSSGIGTSGTRREDAVVGSNGGKVRERSGKGKSE